MSDLYNAWADGDNYPVSTKDAKKIYFLTPSDLAMLPCQRFGGGIGLGPPMKCYRHNDLVEASLSKLGRDGVVKKLQARHKREMNKRRKEEQAEEARKKMKILTNTAANNNDTAVATAKPSSSAVVSSGDSKEIMKLRSSLLKIAKKKLGFEQSGAPKRWRFEVPGTSKQTFASLMGQPNDSELSTFVKNGAYYTVQGFDTNELFGLNGCNYESQLTKAFKRQGVSQMIGECVTVRYKPSTMELSVSGYAEIVGGGSNECVIM